MSGSVMYPHQTIKCTAYLYDLLELYGRPQSHSRRIKLLNIIDLLKCSQTGASPHPY